jgi:Stress responsive A/B Barrel Domain
MLIHSVYFWLKPDADPVLAAAFEAGCRHLMTVPDIKTGYVGRPEATTPRPVIDSSYSWALVVLFDDQAAHDRYQEHEIHERFVQKFSSIWERVQVYDVRA